SRPLPGDRNVVAATNVVVKHFKPVCFASLDRDGLRLLLAAVPPSGVNPPAPPPRLRRGGPRTSGGWPHGWSCKGWAGPVPWFEFHLNQTNHAQDPLCRT
ncbi:MAG: hypothetical protein ACKOPS_10030, partial [Cyanobium sp.]